MKSNMNARSHKLAQFVLFVAITCIQVICINSSTAQCVAPKGTLEGVVYNDYNNNGAKDVDEAGLSGIIINVFNSENTLVKSTLTDASGSYFLNDMEDGVKFRMEFIYGSDMYPSQIGKDNRSSVQQVVSPQCNVSLGLTEDSNGCNGSSEILTTCFVQGPISRHPSEPTIVGIPYGFSSDTPARKFAMQSETGSIWGIAWKEKTKQIYTSAFVKQNSGLTAHGHDAIFVSSFTNGMYSTSLFAKLSDLGQSVGTLSINDVTNCDFGAQVGRIGLGALIISPDQSYLYTINLYNNTLVRIPTQNPTSANTVSYNIPNPRCVDDEYHAFALKYHNNKIYVGVTCTADKSKDEVASSGHVYSFDPITGLFALEFSTNYLKGFWYDFPADGLGHQHWLTDIDFTDEGNMILSLSDRIGHRFCSVSSGSRLDEQKPDILLVWNDNGTWTLESNGSAGSLVGTGVGNGQGPDGGEFFGDDYWIKDPSYHPEIAIGSVYVMPGTQSVVATVFDPELNAYSGGLHRYNTSTGTKEGSKELYTREIIINFGKSTGFGDIIGACGVPQIEIGNLVWLDQNKNGIQDAGENGIAGLEVILYDEECQEIARTITDNQGFYVFNTDNVPAGILKEYDYYIGFNPTLWDEDNQYLQFNGLFYNLTAINNTLTSINSDASAGILDCNAVINFAVNQTSHSFDIGLITNEKCGLKLTKTVNSLGQFKQDDIVTFEISVENLGGTGFNSVTIEDAFPDTYVFDQLLNPSWIVENGVATTTIEETLLPGDKVSSLLALRFSQNNASVNFLNVASITGATNHLDQDIDVRSCVDDSADLTDTALPAICDLALKHEIDVDRIYTPGSLVNFTTTVCNQGTVTSDNFTITNYLNPEFDFSPVANLGWLISSDLTMIQLNETKALLPGECRTYDINYTIKPESDVSSIVNYAEVSAGACGEGKDDFDSTPDTNMLNDKGGQVNTFTDNNLDGNGSDDEDDHDPALVRLDIIDLSIVKTAVTRRAFAGKDVVFEMKITNEGNVPVSRTVLVDYVNPNFTLNDPTWALQGTNAVKEISFPGNLQPGDIFITTCTLTVNINVLHPATITNTVEIKQMFDQFNRDISGYDIDSTPDDNRDNDFRENEKGTEDDISTAYVVLICPAEYEACSNCRAATTPVNGQFETTLKIASAAGEEWVVEQSVGLFTFDSPLPPALPTVLPEGFILTEVPHAHDGHSYYVLQAVHIDKKGFSVRFRNKFGELEVVEVPPVSCSFDNISVEGPLSLCVGGQAVYTAETTISNPTYTWEVDGSEVVGVTGPILNYNWAGFAPGVYEVKVSATPGCIAPTIINVSIGTADNAAIACVGDFNVTLDGDCEVVITPSMLVAGTLNPTSPYVVMLTDKNGLPIPNATLTREHVNTKVMAKLIEGCGGNSCWSTITVEDKLAPVSICRDITLPCHKVDEYTGPFETDNCSGPVTNIIVHEQITRLTCHPDYVKYIDRVYQATDEFGNKSQQCTMRIQVARPDLRGLILPRPYTIANDSALVCSAFLRDAQGNPSVEVTGVPYIGNDALYPSFPDLCNLYAGYTDKVISNLGCVKKIMRTWTIFEQWCSNGTPITYVQMIEITDDVDPIVTAIDNATVALTSHVHCGAYYTVPMPITSDTCSGVSHISVTYPGGFNGDFKVPFDIELTVGMHEILYRVYDFCGNFTQTSHSVTVVDGTAPVAICKGETVLGINSNGEGLLYPRHINDGSYDGCGIDSMKVARMESSAPLLDTDFQDYLIFDCDDVGNTVMVALKVWDTNGNSNSCMVNVTIQDKHRPQIVCPKDVTIDCNVVSAQMDLTIYGEATGIDACGATVTELTPVFDLNSCRVGKIVRYFEATDGQNTATCSQTITVIQSDFFNPLVDVDFPLDYEVNNNACTADELHPDNLPDAYSYPVIRESECGLAAASFKDEVYTFAADACFKIVRKWTVIDWCEMARLGSSYEPYIYSQIIKVNNTEAPFFIGTVADTLTFFTPKGNCTEGTVNTSVAGDDKCTMASRLRWTYKFDIDNDGTYEFQNSGVGSVASINSIIEVGIHRIQWSFEDACGNVTTKDQILVVRNNDGPNAIGLDMISVSINPWDVNGDGKPDIEKGCIVAASLDASSVSVCCTDPLKFSFSADVTDTLKCFDCFDVGAFPVIELWVTDCNGNTDIVTVIVDVQDNNDSDVCDRLCEENAPTPSITGNDEICRGEGTTLTASGGSNYLWSTGATTPSINVNPINTRTYTVTVTNEFRCTATANIEVEVNPLPILSINGNDICVGSTTTLTAFGASTYVWSTGQTSASINVGPSTTTTYSVTGTDTNGCSSAATFIVEVNPLPVVNIEGAFTICLNGTTVLTATGGNTYVWSTGETTESITVSPTQTTTYTVTATDANGCVGTDAQEVIVNPIPSNITLIGDEEICIGQSSTLIASGGVNYVWSTGETTPSITVTPLQTTTYSVTATDANGCQGVRSIEVEVNPLPNIVIAGDDEICLGDTTLLVVQGASTYVWSNGETNDSISVDPLTTTTYSVTGTDSNGCTNTTSVTVVVNPLPTVTITGIDSICINESTELTANGATFYMWNTGESTSSITVSPTQTSTFTVTGTDVNGCQSVASFIVFLKDSPVADILGDTTICLGDSTTLIGIGGEAYIWNNGETNDSIIVRPDVNTTYTVTVTNSLGCTATAQTTVLVDPGTLVCTTQDITVVLDASGQVTITPEQISTGVSGECSSIDLDVFPSQFFCNDVGDQTVTLVVTSTLTGSSLSCTAIVTVLDTINPMLNCPQDLILNCEIFDPNAPLSTYGNATVLDNCPNGIIITEVPIIDLNECNVGTITRTFTATDNSSNSIQCVQVITIQNPDPLVLADIVFPADITISQCDGPADPSVTGDVSIDLSNVSCHGIDVSFEDNIPNGVLCPGMFERLWTVVDTCQLVQGTTNGIFTHVQNIVVDLELPVVTGLDTITIYYDPVTCEAALSGVYHMAQGGCNFVITNNYNSNNDFNVEGVYPEGENVVTFTLTEQCTNATVTFDFVVNALDTTMTQLICVKTFPDITDQLIVEESVYDHVQIFQACSDTLPITVSYTNTDPNDTIRIYDCDDVGLAIPIEVYFWQDGIPFFECNSLVGPEDPGMFCMNISSIVGGNVSTENGQKVKDVSIILNGSDLDPTMTDELGMYSFPAMDERGGAYQVYPDKNDDPLAGVSTLDMIKIHRHILGLDALNSPYKLIAADVTKDNKISAADIVELRKLILGIQDNFITNRSWRMVDKGYSFPFPEDPFYTVFPERYNIDALTSSMQVDWVGVKIGDVDNSFVSNAKSSTGTRSDIEPLYLTDKTLSKGKGIIPVFSNIDDLMYGFQVSLRLDDLSVEDISSDVLKLNEAHYTINGDYLVISWYDPYGVSINEGDILFEIHVDVNNSVKLSHALTIESDVIRPEYYGQILASKSFALSYRVEDENAFEIMGNTPNPWNNATAIHYYLPTQGEVNLRMYDMQGKEIYNKISRMSAGKHSWNISAEEVSTSGIIVYELIFNNEVKSARMINIK